MDLKYKIGASIKIKSNLKSMMNKSYNGVSINSTMLKYAGEKSTIVSSRVNHFGKEIYKIKIDNQVHDWIDEMFDFMRDLENPKQVIEETKKAAQVIGKTVEEQTKIEAEELKKVFWPF